METMPMYYGWDPLYMLFGGIGLVLSLIAQMLVKSAFARYSRVRNLRNMTGAQAAEIMLRSEGINDVAVRRYEGGWLSDHYNPSTKVINLSPEVYDNPTVAAVGIACHEAGHALQHAKGYAPLTIRSALVLPTQIGSSLGIWVIVIGAALGMMGLAKVGFILFVCTFLFSVITLPVELNASSRSKQALLRHGIVQQGPEYNGVASVLNAAAMTYVAAAIASLLQVLYWAIRLGLIGGGRRRD